MAEDSERAYILIEDGQISSALHSKEASFPGAFSAERERTKFFLNDCWQHETGKKKALLGPIFLHVNLSK